MRDADVRSAVRDMLAAQHAGDGNTRIVEEMGVWSGAVRIDLAVINGELSGFELKSDRDTLERLPIQSQVYSKIFDRVSLVVGSRHAGKSIGLIPEWWGVTVAVDVCGTLEMHSLRKGELNPAVEPFLVAQLLWKSECLSVLSSLDMAKGWRARSAVELHRRLADVLPLIELRKHVRQTLKARDGWLGQSIGNERHVATCSDFGPLSTATGT